MWSWFRIAEARGYVAQEANDPDFNTSQLLPNVQTYQHNPVDPAAASFPVHSLPQPDQPFTSGFGSIGPIASPPFANDALGRQIRPRTLYSPSLGINRGFFPTARNQDNVSWQPESSTSVSVEDARLLQGDASRRHPQAASLRSTRKPGNQRGPQKQPRADHAAPLSPQHQIGHQSPSTSNLHTSISPLTFADTASHQPSSAHAPLPLPLFEAVRTDFSLPQVHNPQLMFIAYGQPDPTQRSLDKRKPEDNARIGKIQKKGGACGPCRHIKKRCDDSDHCPLCIHRGKPSGAAFLDGLLTPSYGPGWEKLTLHDLRPSNGLPAQLDSTFLTASQEQAKCHVKGWFKRVTHMIDPQPFHDVMFGREVCLSITSGFNGKRESPFRLDVFDLVAHLEVGAFVLDEKSLLTGLLRHTNHRKPPPPKHLPPGSKCVRELSWFVSSTFDFLKSLANADMYASIKTMPAARATIFAVYASLYRVLLTKGDELCLFILKSLELDFQYCTRRRRADLIDDSLQSLAQYYRVVMGLADLDLKSSSEAAALLSPLTDRAKTLLRDGGIKRMFWRVYQKLEGPSAKKLDEDVQSKANELLSSYSRKAPEIDSLSIAVRTNSGNADLAPVPTKAMRDCAPYHQLRPIKVRDLLKEMGDAHRDARQIYVDHLVGDFGNLHRGELDGPGPSDSCPSCFATPELTTAESGPVMVDSSFPTSLRSEHASLRPSQQDTETASLQSETTMQNELSGMAAEAFSIPARKILEGPGWHHVPRGKGIKRRERSGDSDTSRRHDGLSDRKHFKLDSGRESLPPYNYFGPLTHEPGRLP